MEYQSLNPDIFYLHILRFFPTTLDDLNRAAGKSEATPQASALILDLADNIGVLVGQKTKGWGTIEKVFPLTAQLAQNEKYSIFLVHSLALREDGQPIEGRGVDPVIDVSKSDWEKELYGYFRYPELTAELKKIL